MMKRILLIIFTVLLLGQVNAQVVIKYTTCNLNLRTGDGTEYGVITVIPKGTPVKIEQDCDCSWVPVRYNGYTGYIYAKYLSKYKPKSSINHHSKTKYYTNSKGNKVQSPTYYNAVPAGATALCRDGTYSFSQNRRGTCSHHGGVLRWLR